MLKHVAPVYYNNVYIIQQDGPLIVGSDYIATERTSTSEDDDNTGVAVGVTIAIIVVIVIIIAGVIAVIWYLQ